MDSSQNQTETNPQNIYPTPQDQVPPAPKEPSKTTEQSQQKNSNKTVLYVVLGCVAAVIVIIGILAAMTLVALNSARGRAKDASIKSLVNSQASAAELYYDSNKTYLGWQISSSDQNSAQEIGSFLKTTGLSSSSYVIYGKLPSSGKYFCIDKTGFEGELDQEPSSTVCR